MFIFWSGGYFWKKDQDRNLCTTYSRNHWYSVRQLCYTIMSVEKYLKNITFRKVWTLFMTLYVLNMFRGHYAEHVPHITPDEKALSSFFILNEKH